MKTPRTTNRTLATILPYLLITAGMIGAIASFILTYDTFQLLRNPDFVPACNINPILSCGSVMSTAQASLLGVPNSVYGLVAFSILVAFGILLASGATFRPWIWRSVQIVALIGVVFMHYLFFQGVYVINAICPLCFVVWMITIPTFWYITVHNLREHHITLPHRLTAFIQRHHGDILMAWYVIIFALLIQHFWYYWVTLV